MYVLFCDENFKISGFNNLYLKKSSFDIQNMVNLNKNNKKEFLLFNINSSQKIILIKVRKNYSSAENEKLGANFYKFIKSNFIFNISILDQNVKEFFSKNKLFLDEFIHGIKLKSYIFDKYKSKKDKDIFEIDISNKNKFLNFGKNKRFEALIDGINLTKDLVSEPGNILHPDEYAQRIKKLNQFGLKVVVYDKKFKEIRNECFIGVGQGSIRGSYLVTIEWKGSNSKTKPLAFVGKGVCFDTGGISLKPAKFMEDMTYDMAGSAVVVGLMKNLALRKAKINAVGVVGLVENMPGGNAQRPGDIVKSYSGKTIEVLNTDAEGRLVLADALTFTEKKFKPSFIIDLATLTGAIIVSLGSEYAGLFSNNDKLANNLFNAGKKLKKKFGECHFIKIMIN